MSGSSHALKRDSDGPRRPDLANQVYCADVNAQFERSSSHHGAQLSTFQTSFCVETQCAREAAVMGKHHVLAQPFGQRMRDALGETARVDKNECGAIRKDQLRHAVVDFRPHLVRGHRPKFIARNLDCRFHFTPMTDIDDARVGAQELRDFFDRLHSCRESDALGTTASFRGESVQTC